MKTKYFVASVIGAVGVATVLRGLSERSGKYLERNRRHPLPPIGSDPLTVFKEEIEKLKEIIDPDAIKGFEGALTRFEDGLEEESEGVRGELVQALLLAVMAKNSLEGVSSYVPKGIAFDTILKCETDSVAIVSEDSPNDSMVGKVATLYTYLK